MAIMGGVIFKSNFGFGFVDFNFFFLPLSGFGLGVVREEGFLFFFSCIIFFTIIYDIF